MKKITFVMLIVSAFFFSACEFKLFPDNAVDDYTYDAEYNSDYPDEAYNAFDDVEPYVSVEGAFSVKFPYTPDITVDPISTDYGVYDMHFYTYEPSYDKAYMVAYIDYPDQLFLDKEVEMILEDVVYGMMTGMTIDYMGDLLKDGVKGKAVSGNDGALYMDADVYVSGNRMYQVAVADSYYYASDAYDFMDSFEFL